MKVLRPPARRKVATTCRIPRKMATAMERRGVSPRRRSRWIDGAIRRLLDLDGHMDLIAEGFLDPRTSATVHLTLDAATRRRIDDLLAGAPETLRGRIDVSTVVRAAITQRLIEGS